MLAWGGQSQRVTCQRRPILTRPEKHLDAYLDELEWRFSNRKNPCLFRDTLMKLVKAENLPYQELIGAE